MEEYPIIVDRKRRFIRVWDKDTNYYITFSFDYIEDLNKIIKNPEDVPGVEYPNV